MLASLDLRTSPWNPAFPKQKAAARRSFVSAVSGFNVVDAQLSHRPLSGEKYVVNVWQSLLFLSSCMGGGSISLGLFISLVLL